MPPKKMPTSGTGGQMKLTFGSKSTVQPKLSFGPSKESKDTKKRPVD